MGDYGDFWRDIRRAGQAKRQQNLQKSTKILQEAGIEFDSHNYGIHLIIRTSSGPVNFWPSTGLYNGALKGRGVFNLIRGLRSLKGENEKHDN